MFSKQCIADGIRVINEFNAEDLIIELNLQDEPNRRGFDALEEAVIFCMCHKTREYDISEIQSIRDQVNMIGVDRLFEIIDKNTMISTSDEMIHNPIILLVMTAAGFSRLSDKNIQYQRKRDDPTYDYRNRNIIDMIMIPENDYVSGPDLNCVLDALLSLNTIKEN